jgi:PAS domain-containing protein
MSGSMTTLIQDWETDDARPPRGLEVWFRGENRLTKRTRRLVTAALVLAFVATTAISFVMAVANWNSAPSFVSGQGFSHTYSYKAHSNDTAGADESRTSWIAEAGIIASLLTMIIFTFRAAVMHGRTYERHRSERFLGRMFEQLPDGIALFDKDSRLVTCNQQYVDYYPEEIRDVVKPGIARSTLFKELSKLGLAIPAGADAELALMTVDEDGARQPISRDVRLRDGSWFRMRYVPTADGGFCASISDVTDYKQREEKLAEHERGFRRLIEESVQGIVVVQNWRPVYANQAYAERNSRPQEHPSTGVGSQRVPRPREDPRESQHRVDAVAARVQGRPQGRHDRLARQPDEPHQLVRQDRRTLGRVRRHGTEARA